MGQRGNGLLQSARGEQWAGATQNMTNLAYKSSKHFNGTCCQKKYFSSADQSRQRLVGSVAYFDKRILGEKSN
jgi:hypothetical protein